MPSMRTFSLNSFAGSIPHRGMWSLWENRARTAFSFVSRTAILISFRKEIRSSELSFSPTRMK